MKWGVVYTEAFGEWFDALDREERVSVAAALMLLEDRGPMLDHPYSSQIKGSTGKIRELRIQHQGRPLRALYAFDVERAAVMLLGGDKTCDQRWYRRNVPIAEKLFDEHQATLKEAQ